jgi:hypothetical protein
MAKYKVTAAGKEFEVEAVCFTVSSDWVLFLNTISTNASPEDTVAAFPSAQVASIIRQS